MNKINEVGRRNLYLINSYLSDARVWERSFPSSRTVLDVARGGERQETEDAQGEQAVWHGDSREREDGGDRSGEREDGGDRSGEREDGGDRSGEREEGSHLMSTCLTRKTDNCQSRAVLILGLFDVSVVDTQTCAPPPPHTYPRRFLKCIYIPHSV